MWPLERLPCHGMAKAASSLRAALPLSLGAGGAGLLLYSGGIAMCTLAATSGRR